MSCVVPMKKPKNCYEYGGCPLFDRRYRVCKVAKVDYYDFDKQYADCPLIELPPHGRLIDGDKFYKIMCSHWVLSLGEAYKRLEDFLKKPVIEAEGSEE